MDMVLVLHNITVVDLVKSVVSFLHVVPVTIELDLSRLVEEGCSLTSGF